MSVSVVGAIFIVVGLIAWMASARAFVFVLSVSAAFVTTAAVTVAGSSIPPFYVLAVLATISAVVRWARGYKVRHPALPVLGLFVVWGALLTFLAPTLFKGIPVLDPRGGIDGQVVAPTALDYTAPMFAQVVYLILAAGVVLYLAQRDVLKPTILGPAFLVGSVLSAARLIPGTGGAIDGLFRNYASALYNEFEQRHFGIFAEPSFLSVFSLAASTYALYRFRLSRGRERFGVVVIAALSAVNLVMSYSGTAALAVVVLAGVGLIYYTGRFVFGRMKLHPAMLAIPFLIAFALLIPNPATAALWATIDDKSGSGSFIARSTSDLFSVNLTIQTWGVGVGLGANRPSSFAALLLSSVGIIGVLLFVVFLARAALPARRLPEWVPVGASLVALIVTKVIAESALTTPIMWLALGALIYAARPSATDTNGGPPSDARALTVAGQRRQHR